MRHVKEVPGILLRREQKLAHAHIHDTLCCNVPVSTQDLVRLKHTLYTVFDGSLKLMPESNLPALLVFLNVLLSSLIIGRLDGRSLIISLLQKGMTRDHT